MLSAIFIAKQFYSKNSWKTFLPHCFIDQHHPLLIYQKWYFQLCFCNQWWLKNAFSDSSSMTIFYSYCSGPEEYMGNWRFVICPHLILVDTVPNNSYRFWADLLHKWSFLLGYDWHPWMYIKCHVYLLY